MTSRGVYKMNSRKLGGNLEDVSSLRERRSIPGRVSLVVRSMPHATLGDCEPAVDRDVFNDCGLSGRRCDLTGVDAVDLTKSKVDS